MPGQAAERREPRGPGPPPSLLDPLRKQALVSADGDPEAATAGLSARQFALVEAEPDTRHLGQQR